MRAFTQGSIFRIVYRITIGERGAKSGLSVASPHSTPHPPAPHPAAHRMRRARLDRPRMRRSTADHNLERTRRPGPPPFFATIFRIHFLILKSAPARVGRPEREPLVLPRFAVPPQRFVMFGPRIVRDGRRHSLHQRLVEVAARPISRGNTVARPLRHNPCKPSFQWP